MNFSEWVRHMRLERRMDLRAFAELVGIDHGNLSRIENARLEVTLITVARICAGLGVSPPLLLEMLYGKQIPHLALRASLEKENAMPALNDVEVFLSSLLNNWHAGQILLADLLNTLDAFHTPEKIRMKRHEKQTFIPQDVEKFFSHSPLYHAELHYPPDLEPHDIWTLYQSGGFLNENDISMYLRKTRHEKRLSLARLQSQVKISDSTLSRIEGGALERVKLTDVMTLDGQLEQDGKLLVLCLQVCHFHERVVSFSQIAQRNEKDIRVHQTDGEMQMVSMFVLICRWLLQDYPHDSRWGDEVREKLTQYARQEETIESDGEVFTQ